MKNTMTIFLCFMHLHGITDDKWKWVNIFCFSKSNIIVAINVFPMSYLACLLLIIRCVKCAHKIYSKTHENLAISNKNDPCKWKRNWVCFLLSMFLIVHLRISFPFVIIPKKMCCYVCSRFMLFKRKKNIYIIFVEINNHERFGLLF